MFATSGERSSRLANIITRPMTLTICTYWVFFWLMNGLDKFPARTRLGLFQRWADDRIEKFAMYFERLSFNEGLTWPTPCSARLAEAIDVEIEPHCRLTSAALAIMCRAARVEPSDSKLELGVDSLPLF
jgi:hypothetical protein